MATTPEGTPYVESSDLVANYPAASLALANRVDLVGVLPFADSAARATAIPSPSDGQYSYLQDTNSTEFWNGAAWVAAGISPGMVHISTTTFSAAATVNVDNCFSATYDNYKIIVENTARSATSVGMTFRFRVGGATNSTSNYAQMYIAVWGFNTTQISYNPTATSFDVSGNGSSSTGLTGTFDVLTPNKSTKTTLTPIGSQNVASGNQSGYINWQFFNDTTVFDGFSLISGGTHTGSVSVYGYRKS
jgi:hypothetical protein